MSMDQLHSGVLYLPNDTQIMTGSSSSKTGPSIPHC